MVFQIIPQRPLNITSILNNFKSFIKQVYEKHRTQNIDNKSNQKNYFRPEISQKED